jgi:syntaxin-binding protein 1
MSLKLKLKSKILFELDKIKDFKNLIVDEDSLKLLNSILSMDDLLQKDITKVENIKSKRSLSVPCLVYFVSNSLDSLVVLQQDFHLLDSGFAVHVICSSHLSDTLFDKLKNSPIRSYIHSMIDLEIDFICEDFNCFSLNSPGLIQTFQSLQDSIIDYELRSMAKKITSVLFNMNEFPIVKYYQKPVAFQTSRPKTICSRLAVLIKEELEREYENSQRSGIRSTLLILDRNIDPMSLLLHDVYYQTLLADLLGYSRGIVKVDGVDFSLDENDPVWVKIKSWHIGNVVDFLQTEMKKFTSENKAAQFDLNGGARSIEALKDVVTSFGEYGETKEILAKHINLSSSISSVFADRGLESVVDLEQLIVCPG